MVRDKFSESEATSRIEAQMPLEEKRRRADFVIENSRSSEFTKEQVTEIHGKLKQSKAHWIIRIPLFLIGLTLISVIVKLSSNTT
jgi:dephospho-CoA kinase